MLSSCKWPPQPPSAPPPLSQFWRYMENDLNTSKLRKGDKWGNVWSALGWLWSCVAFESGGGVSYMGGLCLPASSDHLNILLHLLVGCELNFKPFSSCPKQETVRRHQFLCISQGTHQNVVEILKKMTSAHEAWPLPGFHCASVWYPAVMSDVDKYGHWQCWKSKDWKVSIWQ